MASQRNTGAFVAGGLLGGLIGAAAVLWKTPRSGAELRGSLGGDRHGAVTYRAGEGQTVESERRFGNPVLGFVEKATAPIVGVELGKLAKDDPNAMAAAPARPSAADARPPVHGDAPVTGSSVSSMDPASVRSRATSGFAPVGSVEPAPVRDASPAEEAFAAQSAEEEATHDPVEGSHAHAATEAELTSPTPEYVEQLTEETDATRHAAETVEFPEVPRRDTT